MIIRNHSVFGVLLGFVNTISLDAAAAEIGLLSNVELEEGLTKGVKAFLPKREFCQKALELASLGGTLDPNLKNDRRGCAGTVCFTGDGKYAIKRSFGIPHGNINQLDRLNTATKAIQSLKNPGFEMNLPLKMFRVKSKNQKLEMCNIQIYPKVNSALTLGEFLHVYRKDQNQKDLDIIELCGKNLARLQSNAIIYTEKYDLGPHHGDFHKGNILVNFPKNRRPCLTVIDIESFHKHGKLIHDPVYFIYTCSSIFIKPGVPIEDSFKMMDPIVKRFYLGYVMTLPTPAVKKMHKIFNAPNLSKNGPLASAMGYGYKSADIKSPFLEPMQQKYFNEAFNHRFSNKPKKVDQQNDSDYYLLALSMHKDLDLSHTKTKNLDFLEMLPNIQVLNLSHTPVHNFDALQNLTTLEEINLSNTAISDVSSLENLTTLKKLDLTNTLIGSDDIMTLRKRLPDCKIIGG